MNDHVDREPGSNAVAPWPCPLLCLGWRLGWGGRRLIDSHEVRSRSDERPTRADEIHAPAEAAPSEADDDGPGPWAGADGGDTTVDRVQAMLRNSPMMPRSRDAIAVDAIAATVRLIGEPPARRRDVGVPRFWRAALACWPGFRTPCPVPSPRPRWDPATWTLVALLEGVWDTTGTTFLGRERPLLFRVAGTRRMAARHGWSDRRALACGRTAHRIWRHWLETREAPRLAALSRWPVPPTLRNQLPDMAGPYRRIRAARRTGQWTPDLDAMPASCRVMLAHIAEASVRELRPPVVAGRPPGLRDAVARALLASPLGRVAAQSCLDASALRAAAEQTAARLLWLLTAPWPWAPRPVVRGPRRARQEARARATGR
jgi:hypothetical protein